VLALACGCAVDLFDLDAARCPDAALQPLAEEDERLVRRRALRKLLFARTIEELDDRVGAGERIPIAKVKGCRPAGWRRNWNRAFAR